MDIFNFDPNALMSFYLTLFRVSIVLFLLPFFGGETTPVPVKAALVLVLTLALWPQVSFPGTLMPASPWLIVIMIAGEALLGLIMGLIIRFLFAAVQTGGQIIGFQMGFAMVNVVDPMTGTSQAATAHFLYMVTMLVFLSLNGPLYFLQGLGKSFELVPPGGLLLTPALAHHIFEFSSLMFVLGIKIAAPVMAALFLVDLALALIGKAAPQIHVMVLGFPIKIAVGFFFLAILFELISTYTGNQVRHLNEYYINLLHIAGGN